MSRAIEAVKAHFAALQGRAIDIPEWGIEGARSAPLTVGDKSWIVGKAGDDSFLQDLYLVIRKLVLASGEPAFQPGDAAALKHEADERVIRRVAAEILAGPGEGELGN